MGRHIAAARSPFGGGIREYHAVFAGGIFCDLLTALACLDNNMAGAAIESAAFFGHEKTFLTLFYSCANHFNHILSICFPTQECGNDKNINFEPRLMPDRILFVKQNRHAAGVFKVKNNATAEMNGAVKVIGRASSQQPASEILIPAQPNRDPVP
jgi:hypothetical protein